MRKYRVQYLNRAARKRNGAVYAGQDTNKSHVNASNILSADSIQFKARYANLGKFLTKGAKECEVPRKEEKEIGTDLSEPRTTKDIKSITQRVKELIEERRRQKHEQSVNSPKKNLAGRSAAHTRGDNKVAPSSPYNAKSVMEHNSTQNPLFSYEERGQGLKIATEYQTNPVNTDRYEKERRIINVILDQNDAKKPNTSIRGKTVSTKSSQHLNKTCLPMRAESKRIQNPMCRGVEDRLLLWDKVREKKVAEKRKNKEMDECAECTFKPRVKGRKWGKELVESQLSLSPGDLNVLNTSNSYSKINEVKSRINKNALSRTQDCQDMVQTNDFVNLLASGIKKEAQKSFKSGF